MTFRMTLTARGMGWWDYECRWGRTVFSHSLALRLSQKNGFPRIPPRKLWYIPVLNVHRLSEHPPFSGELHPKIAKIMCIILLWFYIAKKFGEEILRHWGRQPPPGCNLDSNGDGYLICWHLQGRAPVVKLLDLQTTWIVPRCSMVLEYLPTFGSFLG